MIQPAHKKSRQDRIAEYRQSQPIDLLRQRADMARTKSRLWTQEELDVAVIESRQMYRKICGID